MIIEWNPDLVRRAAAHAALGDPARLAIVDALALGEASPSELQSLLTMPSNLLAHHVGVLERAGVIRRSRSEGDHRRTYLGVIPGALDGLLCSASRGAVRVVFVCTQNSARSQLAAALWTGESSVPVTSAGTRPAAQVHPGAVAAAQRHGVGLHPVIPRHVTDVVRDADFVITVCDSAHEELTPPTPPPEWAHWSVPDPARSGDDAAFDRTVAELNERISRTASAVHPIAI